MAKIISMVLNMAVTSIEDSRIFYKKVMNFTDIFEVKDKNHHEIIFYHPTLANDLLIRVTKQDKKNFIKPSADHLLIFYLNDENIFKNLMATLNQAGIQEISSLNPYWSKCAKTFLGPSGYRIVLHAGSYHHYKVRIARPTGHIDNIHKFYTSELGFNRIGEFKTHEGFDGIMFGIDNLDCHLEMTYQHDCHQEKSHASSYFIELIASDSHPEIQELYDPDRYIVSINSKKNFLNKYISIITSRKNMDKFDFLKGN